MLGPMNGSFDKVKGRFVAGGDRIDLTTVGTTAAPTVNYITVMAVINLAAMRNDVIETHDRTTSCGSVRSSSKTKIGNSCSFSLLRA